MRVKVFASEPGSSEVRDVLWLCFTVEACFLSEKECWVDCFATRQRLLFQFGCLNVQTVAGGAYIFCAVSYVISKKLVTAPNSNIRTSMNISVRIGVDMQIHFSIRTSIIVHVVVLILTGIATSIFCFGCFHKLGVALKGDLRMSPTVFGVYTRVPDFGNSHISASVGCPCVPVLLNGSF